MNTPSLLEDLKTYRVLKEYALGEKIKEIQDGFGLSASSLYEIINRCDVIKRQDHPVTVRSVDDLSVRARNVVKKGYFEYKIFSTEDCFNLFGIEKVSKEANPNDILKDFFEKAEDLKSVMETISNLESKAKELLLDLKHNEKLLEDNKATARELKENLSTLLKDVL